MGSAIVVPDMAAVMVEEVTLPATGLAETVASCHWAMTGNDCGEKSHNHTVVRHTRTPWHDDRVHG